MTEDILNAIQSFLANKTRSILSLLGVVIGVAAVIMVTAIGESASADVKSTISQSGLDMVNIRGGNMRKIRALQFDEKKMIYKSKQLKRLAKTFKPSGAIQRSRQPIELNSSHLSAHCEFSESKNIQYFSLFLFI